MAAHEKEAHDCIICANALGTNGGTLTLLCGHPFCAECICRWRQRSWRCPVCRVMDNRELSATGAQAAAGRSGNIGQVSRRLRPMAEQLLAESGDNVLDVLLQLLEGIQDGTLPADVETAALAAASSSTARIPAGAPGGTSLDRLVLNQLVTVLQATSTLTSGAPRPATAAAGLDGSTQPQARPASSHRSRHHPSERRRRGAAAVQPPGDGAAQAPGLAIGPAAAAPKPVTVRISAAGPSIDAALPEPQTSQPAVAPTKCDASTQTSDLSDGEERRARRSRLKRVTRRAHPPETNMSIGPKHTDAGAAGLIGSADQHSLQAAWVQGRDGLQGASKQAAQSSAGPEHAGVKAVSEAGSSCSSLPSSAAKGKEKEASDFGGNLTAGSMDTGTEQRLRLQDQPSPSAFLGQPGAGAPSAPALGSAGVKVAGNPFQEKAAPDETAASSSAGKAPSSAEPSAFDHSQVRRAWEARFGPGKQAGGPLPRKRSLEGPEPSESSTSGLSSASGVATPQLPVPGPGQLLGSGAALLAPTAASIPRSASAESPGPSQGGASPAAPLRLPARPALSEPLYQAAQQGPNPAAAPAVHPEPVIDAPEAPLPAADDHVFDGPVAQAPPPAGSVPAFDGAAHGHAVGSAAGVCGSAVPQHGSAQRSGSSSDASALVPAEAPDTATPSMSGDSFTDPGPLGDDSTFVTSRATSLARTLSLEEFPPAETPQGSSPSADAIPGRPRAASVSLPTAAAGPSASLLGRRRTRSEAEQGQSGSQQRPAVVAPPNTAAQSFANSGASSPRTLMDPASAPALAFTPGSGFQPGEAASEGVKPTEANMQRRGLARSGRSSSSRHSYEREQLLLRAVDEVENLVDNLLARWNSLPASQQPPHLGERLEELFLEASMLEAVRNNQVPKPRAMVEDILARVTLLDAELGSHVGPVPPPSPTSSMGSPRASGSGSQVPASMLAGGPGEAVGRLDSHAPGSSEGFSGHPEQLSELQQPAQQAAPIVTAPVPPAGALEAPPGLEMASQAPVSLMPVGSMPQGTSPRPAPRSARSAAHERRARRSAAARRAASPPNANVAAEAEGALDRFTAFLEHHENELRPRTRQIAELALTLARLSLVNSAPEQPAQAAIAAPTTPFGSLPQA